jgi:hypothetical protein
MVPSPETFREFYIRLIGNGKRIKKDKLVEVLLNWKAWYDYNVERKNIEEQELMVFESLLASGNLRD